MHIFRKLGKLSMMNSKETSVTEISENDSKGKQCVESVQSKKKDIFLKKSRKC